MRLAAHFDRPDIGIMVHRRPREERELAGWQCAAARTVLHMETRELAPLAGTTKQTIHRFESGEFMPRPQTVLAIEKVLRDRGVVPTFYSQGEPRGISVGWAAYSRAYPARPIKKHRSIPEETAARLRAREKEQAQAPKPPAPPKSPINRVQLDQGMIADLEAQARQLQAELTRLRGNEWAEDEDEDF
jgi:DNA-binding XRE family transcriptional regulator